jgi:hypothetical protein
MWAALKQAKKLWDSDNATTVAIQERCAAIAEEMGGGRAEKARARGGGGGGSESEDLEGDMAPRPPSAARMRKPRRTTRRHRQRPQQAMSARLERGLSSEVRHPQTIQPPQAGSLCIRSHLFSHQRSGSPLVRIDGTANRWECNRWKGAARRLCSAACSAAGALVPGPPAAGH